jgi:hypothetical protein
MDPDKKHHFKISLSNGDILPDDTRVTIIARRVGDIVCLVDDPYELAIEDYLMERAGNDDGGSSSHLRDAEHIEEIIKNCESKLWDRLAAEKIQESFCKESSDNEEDDNEEELSGAEEDTSVGNDEDDRKQPAIENVQPPLSQFTNTVAAA